jgi:hypothetical protein
MFPVCLCASQVASRLNVEYQYLWLVGALVALLASSFLVLRRWDSYDLPIRLIPADVLTVILLIDLNIKSMNGVTVEDDFVMKLEALAFTGLLVLVLFAPVLWKAVMDRRKSSAKSIK